MKKKTPTQKYIDEAATLAAEKATGNIDVSNCEFNAVKWDENAVSAVETIATGLVENAKALGVLAEVLKASNVHIDTLVHIGGKKLI